MLLQELQPHEMMQGLIREIPCLEDSKRDTPVKETSGPVKVHAQPLAEDHLLWTMLTRLVQIRFHYIL